MTSINTAEELERERDAYRLALEERNEAIADSITALRAAEERAQRAERERDALLPYVDHLWECAINDSVQGADECTCGLHALLNAEHQT